MQILGRKISGMDIVAGVIVMFCMAAGAAFGQGWPNMAAQLQSLFVR